MLGIIFLVLASFSWSGFFASSLGEWLVLGSLGGLVLSLLFRYLIRSDFGLIPFLTGMTLEMALWRQVSMRPYTHASRDAIIAMVFLILAMMILGQRKNSASQ